MSHVKQHIISIPQLIEKQDKLPLIDLLRPWMLVTGLEFKDAIHLPYATLIDHLQKIHAKIGSVMDVLEEDQAIEAACRAVGSFDIYDDGSLEAFSKQTVRWNGHAWISILDPKTRLLDENRSFVEARDKILEMFRGGE